jgi:acyl dehydratase
LEGAEMVQSDSIITDEMRKALRIGEELGPFTYEVERSWIRRFVGALGDRNPLWTEEAYAKQEGPFDALVAPPTFYIVMDPVETKELKLQDFLEGLPFKRTMQANAFNEVEYFQPIQAGDVITVTTRYTELIEKEGRVGHLVFPVRENVYRNQRDELVAKSRCSHVFGYDLTGLPP